MPRKLRAEYPGAVYHVMSRGDGCAAIFLDDVDRQDYLKTLAEGCQKTGWGCGNPPTPPMNRAESGPGWFDPFLTIYETGQAARNQVNDSLQCQVASASGDREDWIVDPAIPAQERKREAPITGHDDG